MAVDDQPTSTKEIPPEFFLPPADNAELWRETRMLLALSVGFIVALAVLVALTQGIEFKL
ncbi:hypothetical protein KXD97_26665 [Mycobacterium sp. SMC-8]|uniref:DUF7156 family protein n=1 Tax=Mycobacterium sp. SMC-8 TaxID=2857060 RepID=UPI0021B3877D|nr:hypothetical protein [Mycobacterium sp. SMC-8]UXA11544.1 hypothetical protein KXD97_26665 [Mycobacterium sp. SMC-8]